MSMCNEMKRVQKAKHDALRFIAAVEELEARHDKDGDCVFYGCRETGAMKRASMDLTRALADVRRGGRAS